MGSRVRPCFAKRIGLTARRAHTSLPRWKTPISSTPVPGRPTRSGSRPVAGVEPAESAVLSGGPIGAHKIDGIGAGYVVPLWHDGIADELERVSTDDARAMAFRLAAEEGLFSGTSTGFKRNGRITTRRTRRRFERFIGADAAGFHCRLPIDYRASTAATTRMSRTRRSSTTSWRPCRNSIARDAIPARSGSVVSGTRVRPGVLPLGFRARPQLRFRRAGNCDGGPSFSATNRPPLSSLLRCELAVCAVMPATRANSPAGRA